VPNDLLRVDFYESGAGETIIITFPNGEIGIVDAHPSRCGRRPDIASLTEGKELKFICATHPHEDHCLDLLEVANLRKFKEFWFPTFEVQAFSYIITETPCFGGNLQEYINEYRRKNCVAFNDLLEKVIDLFNQKKIDLIRTIAEREPLTIAGVTVNILSPTERVVNNFIRSLSSAGLSNAKSIPNLNTLSVVLSVSFGGKTLLLGGDALRANWNETIQSFYRKKIPKASAVKVPHHGASNAFNTGKSQRTYLDISNTSSDLVSVLFAGDRQHPNMEVFRIIKSKSKLICLNNGRKPHPAPVDPLGLSKSKGQFVAPIDACNPIITLEISSSGDFRIVNGATCDFCKTP
jgi:beta-lactamase superfamily II metal-dependent hydrolase